MTGEQALAELARLRDLRGGLTSEAGIKSTLGRRRNLEQRWQQAIRAAEKAGVIKGLKSKAKYRTL